MSLKYRLLLFFIIITQVVSARSFKDFQVVHYGDESLPQTSIGDIAIDDQGYIWLCTQMGLVRFDGQQFRTYTPSNTPTLKGIRSRFFCRDKENRLYYWDDSYSFYEMKGGKFIPVSPGQYSDAIKSHVKAGNESGDHDLLEPGKMPIYIVSQLMNPARTAYYLFGNDTSAVFPEAQPTAYAFFEGKAIFVFEDHSFKLMYAGKPVDKKLTIKGDITRDSLWTDKSARLTGCYQPGKLFLRLGNTIYRAILSGNELQTSTVITGLDIKLISTIYEDERNGYVAIGTQTEGLYVLYPKSFSTRLLNSGMNSNSFYQIGHIRDNIFLNSIGYEFDLYKDYEKQLVDAKGHGCYRHGDYLITGTDAGLKGINVKTGEIKTYIPNMRPHGWFLQGYDDPWGRSWIASSNGFASLDTKHDVFNWIPLFTNNYVTETDNVENFHFLNKDSVLIGCRRGMILLNTLDNKSVKVPEMHMKNVRNFVEAGDGGLWILTYGSGYYHYKNGHYRTMPMDRNRFLESVHTMLLDKNGFYWMSTNKGLFRVSRNVLLQYVADSSKDVRYEYFNKQCGFETNEFNGGCSPCGVVVSDSLFLLPNMIGLVHFNPLEIRTPSLNSPIYIDKIMVDGKEVSTANIYNIPSEFSSFYCEVSTPFFGLRENLVLEYKIDGINNNWQPLINNRYLQFNRLPHGNYQIHIRKLTSFSSNAYSIQTIRVTVETPVYLRTWFLILVGMLVLFLFGLVVRLRVRLLTRQKQRLEEQVEDRTNQLARSLSQLKETVITLEKSQAELYRNNLFKEQLTSIVLHDIQTPLRFLKRVVKNVQQNYRTLQPEKLGEELDDLYNATAEVTDYSKDFLTWIKSQKDGFTIAPLRVNLSALLESVSNLYQKIAQNAGAAIIIKCPPDLELETDPALLGIIIRNLTDNAIKYAAKGLIILHAERTGDKVIISIADNGKGMSEVQIAEVMNEDMPSITVTDGKLGYRLIKDLLLVLHGVLRIESTIGQGTTVRLYFDATRAPAVVK